MKTIIYTLLLLCLFACKLPTQTNEAIFKYDNGEIVTKPEYINPFYFEYQDVKSYPVESFTIFSKNNEHSYSVKLSNYQGTEGDGGYYRSIDVEYKNKNILSLKQSDGWDKLQKHVRPLASNDYFLALPLTDSSTALVFVGYPYNSQPELLTIVILNKGEATLVFNKEIMIRSIKYDKANLSFVMNLQDYPVEYLDVDTPCYTPKFFKILLGKGILKFEGPYNTIEE